MMGQPASMLSKKAAEFMNWIDERLPVTSFYNEHLAKYYAPKNFNFWYYMGSLALLALVMQIVTGIFLTMHYKPSADQAFASVEYIMRDVDWGWLIRYMHSTGASMFFIVVYLHMFRALLYGSHRKPRELLWVLGVLIYLALMAEAFMGYVLPWGQMSYWGAQVIINLFGAIPSIGEPLTEWIRGDYFISDATLNRFFALHVIAIPLALLVLVVLHLAALHQTGSNNPDGIEIKKLKGPDGVPLDGIPFHPYYTVKDIFGVAIFLLIMAFIIFFGRSRGLVSGTRQFRASRSNGDTDAHQASLVFHAVLRNSQGRSRQTDGRGADGRFCNSPVFCALAGPFTGKVHSLSRAAVQSHARLVQCCVRPARHARHGGRNPGTNLGNAYLDFRLLRLFHPAVLPQPQGTHQAGT
jgi:hypothetical protein